MLRSQRMSAELDLELRKLSRGMEMSFHSSLKIGHFFLKKTIRIIKRQLGGWFWFLIESPKLWESIGPDKKRQYESAKEYHPYIHPPSGLQLH